MVLGIIPNTKFVYSLKEGTAFDSSLFIFSFKFTIAI